MFVIGQSRLAKARRSRIHGRGLFAKKDIPAGERIIEYTGEKITKAEGNRRYDEQAKNGQIYLFELNSRYDVDGSTRGNIAKYANHSCDPNAETIVEKGEIWLIALDDIKKGDEITFDYNFPLFDYEKRPCRCNTDKCRGWIINRDSYNYLQRKKKAAKKGPGAKKAGRKAKKGLGASPGKKSAKKAAKKTGKKTGKKAAKNTGKKTGKKAAKKPGKQATKKTSKRASKAAKKTRKRAA